MVVDRSAVRRRRLTAFLLGSGLGLVFLRHSPFDVFPAPLAAAACSLPVTLCGYGLSERSWKSMALIGAGVAVGAGLGTALDGGTIL